MEQELRLTVGLCRLEALSSLIEVYAYKNRAKMVQRLMELKHAEEQKLGLNKSLEAQYSLQNPATCRLSLGADSHITIKEVKINGGSSIL